MHEGVSSTRCSNDSGIDVGVVDFALALERSPIGTAVVSTEGHWLWANDTLCKLLGYSKSEIIKQSFARIIHPDDRDAAISATRELVAGRTPSYGVPKRYLRKDGSLVLVETTGSLVRDVSGRPRYYVIHVMDMTERRAAEVDQLRLLERIALATEIAGIGIWEIDLKTQKVYSDETTCKLYGHSNSEQECTEGLMEKTLHPDDREATLQRHHAVFELGYSDVEFRTVRADGEVRHLKCLSRLLRDHDGVPQRILGANWDMTETKVLAERAMAASEAKSRFLAVVSHEIRTPLNGILGMAQAMARQPLPEAQQSQLEVILDSGQALLSVVNDVLDHSKIEAGKLTLEDIEFDLGRVLLGAHSAYAEIANDKGLRLGIDLGDAEGRYRGDPTRVRQIVSNLVSNAVKFTSSGSVQVRAKAFGGRVEISVADTGEGIPKDRIDQIFSAFEQADGATTRRFGGTGLGLAIARELAELMGGGIEVESSPGAGSVFTLALPLPRLPDSESGEADSAAGEERAEYVARVLAAEDNTTNQLVLRTLLSLMGIEPVIVEDGQKAVEAWEAAEWDLILMDVQMPVLDGLAATRAIRQRESREGRARTPIIALTANALQENVEACLTTGMDSLVAKPIDVRALAVAIESALASRTHMAAAAA